MSIQHLQTTLNLYDNQGLTSLIQSRGIIDITVKIAPRLKKSWRITFPRPPHPAQLTIPAFLDRAPMDIKHSLIEWAQLQISRSRNRRLSSNAQRKKQEIEARIWHYMEKKGHASAQRSISTTRIPFVTAGTRYDLREVFDELNNTYFGNRLTSLIRWGRYGSRTSYHTSMRNDNNDAVNVITIAGVYDHPSVPDFAIYGIVHHEMCHIACPPYTKNGTRRIHTPEFRRVEKKYFCHEKWYRWEQTHLPGVIRKMKKQIRKKRRRR